MENNELRKIWNTIDTEINQKSKVELDVLLNKKSRETMNKFLIIMGLSIFVCIGLLIFLAVTAVHRRNDFIYVLNNATLGIVTLVSLISGLWSWYKIQNNAFHQPLKNWLESRISLLSKWLTGRYSKLYLVLISFLYVLTILSIHVYFENKPFVEVFKTEESLIGLMVGAPFGLFAAYLGASKIRKYQIHNLEYLKELYARLCEQE